MIERTLWSCNRLKSHKGMDGRWQVEDPKDAILISSLTKGGLHAPCLDFDFPGMVAPWDGRYFHMMWINGGHSARDRSDVWASLHAALAAADLVDASYWVTMINKALGHAQRDPELRGIIYNVPVRAIPSSNPYKHHFYIDAEITWDLYKPIIEALRDLALLEFNFAKFSIQREMTMLLRPGLRKDDLEAMGIVIEETSDGQTAVDAAAKRLAEQMAEDLRDNFIGERRD
jgi:hypothetical protein